jgi:predicted  nucleic acid-binding Zn-ribbon protein
MPRVYHVKAARKSIKSAGVEVGDSYYWWKFRHGGKHVSKTPPRASQLTQSDKKSRAFAAAEALEDISVDADTELDDLKSQLDDIASEVGEIAQEYRDSKDNMPESLQDSDTANLCEENADALESWQSDIEQALDSIDEDDEGWRDEAASAIQDVAGGCPL